MKGKALGGIIIILFVICASLAWKLSVSPPCVNKQQSLDQHFQHLDYNWYFTITAPKAFIEKRGDDFYLVLNYFDKAVPAVADRPHRNSKTFDIQELLDYWHVIYRDVPPNAMLFGNLHDEAGAHHVIDDLELLAPRLVNNKTLEFSVLPLDHTEIKDDQELDNVLIVIDENWKASHVMPKHVAT